MHVGRAGLTLVCSVLDLHGCLLAVGVPQLLTAWQLCGTCADQSRNTDKALTQAFATSECCRDFRMLRDAAAAQG